VAPHNIGLSYQGYNDHLPEKDFWIFIEKVFRQLYRVLKDKHHLVFTCAQKHIWIYRPMLENIGFTFRHLAIWHNPKRKAGSYPGQWPFSYEPIMDFTKGGFKKLNNKNCVGFMDIWIEEPPKADHPAARPLKCWINLVKLRGILTFIRKLYIL